MENVKICPKCDGRKIPKKSEKVGILELDEMCVNFKKKYGSGQL